MSSIPENRYSIKGSLFAVIILALLTLADNVLTNTMPFALGAGPPQIPGFWNLTTASLVLSVVSDLVGQPVLILLSHHYNSRCATNVNILSLAIASICSLILLFWRTDELAWASALTSIFKIIGGGSHATAFLTIFVIWENTSGSFRAALIYITGAVIVLCQTIASSVTPFLAGQCLALPYIFSVACCILAGFVVRVHDAMGSPSSDQEWTNDCSAQPLLSPRAASEDPPLALPLSILGAYSNIWHDKPFTTRKVLKSLGFVFLLAATAKATRPLFITYIQHRVGIAPTEANRLWLIRTSMSLVIFSAVLPLVIIRWSKTPLRLPTPMNLYVAKISIVLLAAGAFLIGVARSKPVLMAGLVINTLGVATDLALLALAADIVPENIANCFFMVIASIESAGTLIGIAVLYPLYQRCLDDDTLFGGMPYYICTGLFIMCGVIVWSLKPLPIP